MRFFYSKFWKYLAYVYAGIVIVFGWNLFLRQIPSHIYVEKGQQVDQNLTRLVNLREKGDSKTVFSEIGNVTFEEMQQFIGKSARAQKDCIMECYLFGIFPIKTVDVTVMEHKWVYPSGKLIGIYEKSNGVLVLDVIKVTDVNGHEQPVTTSRIQRGDYITKVNNVQIESKEQLAELIKNNGQKQVDIEYLRGKSTYNVKVTPVKNASGENVLGIWVKDDMAGIGTMTYYDEKGEFGALGHGIGDGVTGDLLNTSSGYIYNIELSQVVKGERGNPGEIGGIIHYSKKNRLGHLEGNSSCGIFGQLEEASTSGNGQQLMEQGFKQEIEKGDAYILSDISGEIKKYDIKILDIDYEATDSNKGLLIEITDEELLDTTAGIVQGMSGSPIIQNGKIIGAVTHVLVNDPTRGYGIFIENMLY